MPRRLITHTHPAKVSSARQDQPTWVGRKGSSITPAKLFDTKRVARHRGNDVLVGWNFGYSHKATNEQVMKFVEDMRKEERGYLMSPELRGYLKNGAFLWVWLGKGALYFSHTRPGTQKLGDGDASI